MNAAVVLAELLRINLVASGAIVLVLVLRPLTLRFFGAAVTYWLWLVVPIAVAATFVPAREQIVQTPAPAVLEVEVEATTADAPAVNPSSRVSAGVAVPQGAFAPALAEMLLAVWLAGAVMLFARSIASTRRVAADPSMGPALVGVLRPRLLLPADFDSRFDAQERALILAHEEVHRVSGHTIVNAWVEIARCASWFNPLVHIAARQVRADQELACDAEVIAARPAQRHAYAHTLLKTQLAHSFLPLGCIWTSRSAKRLAERIEMVGRASLGRVGKFAGAAGIAAVSCVLGYAAWAQQPARLVTQVAARPEAVWTPSDQAPAGALTHALEAQRHNSFIELAQKGDIELVFFGSTETEMWSWNGRGKSVWHREFGSLKAANFGSQGTNPRSLLWRMQNGELDGYEAKLVVIQLGGRSISDPFSPDREAEFLAGWSSIIAEIRARQPQAKILIHTPIPSGISPLDRRESWRELWDANATVITRLADDETVFYADFGERFFNPDGSYNHDYWGGLPGPAAVGAQPAAFEVRAEQLQPWLDRFVR